MPEHKSPISIWLFIGALLLFYGLLIVGAEVWVASHPAAQPVVLAEYHFGYWMGGVLILLGGYYCLHFRPGKR